MEKVKKLEYFLGANTPDGFVSLYDNLISLRDCNRLYIIKGGPGSGKSTLINKIGSTALEKGLETHFVHCSGDPPSLDGVYIPKLKTAIVDGTSPHVIEPKFPGAVETVVDMSRCWERQVLKDERERIIDISLAYKSFYDIAYRYLSAAGKVESDMYSAVISGTDFSKINEFCHRFIKKHGLKTNLKPQKAVERFISSPTCEGIYSFKDSLCEYSEKCVIIQDFCGIGGIVLSTLRDIALNKGIDVDVYYSGMNRKNGVEALYFKDCGLCVILSGRFSPFSLAGVRSIRALRFVDDCTVTEQKQRIQSDKRIEYSLMEQAQLALQTAKTLHDALEESYIAAMNYDTAEEIGTEILNEIFS